MNLDLSAFTWELVEITNQSLCANGKLLHQRAEGYDAASQLWNARQIPCALMEGLDLARKAHRLAPFIFLNGPTFASVLTVAIGRQIKIPAPKLKVLTSLSAHYIAGNIADDEKDALVMLLDSLQGTLTVGDAVQTLKGTVRGVVVELLPDGCVKYRTAQGIIIKASADALVKR